MANLLEMAADIVAAHASTNPMAKDELLKLIQDVYKELCSMEKGETCCAEAVEEAKPAMSGKQSIGKNAITCLICGEKMKTLSRHLKTKHDMKPGAYRKQFGIPSTQSLAAKAYSESRRQMAVDKNLGAGLAKARAAKAAAPKAKKISASAKKKA